MGFRDRSLGRDIAVVPAFKLVAVAAIWGAFFNPRTRAAIGPPALGARLVPGPDGTR